MAKVLKKDLGFLGIDYQYRLIKCFIEDKNFFKDLEKIIDNNMFSEIYLRTIVGVMKDYFEKYDGSMPSYDTIAMLLRSKATSEEEIEYYMEALEKIKGMSSEASDEVKELAEKFFKQQNWIRIANEIKNIAGDGDMSKYEDCQKLINEALSIGRRGDDVSNPYDNVEDDLAAESVVSIPTGVSKLDEALVGGLDKGKIGLIIGSSGFGKTSMTTGIAAYAATCKTETNGYEGFKVLQIVFEDTHRDIHRKYFSRFTKIETCKINESEERTEEVRETLKNFQDKEMVRNNIRIVKLLSGEKTVKDIENIIKKRINEGFKPDMVILDYFECLKYEKANSEWEGEGKSMRKLENLAHDLDVAMWIPTQGSRGSFTSELVTMDQGGGSIKKQQIAQVVISITRSVEDTNNKRATLTLLKNRSGRAGVTLNGIIFDNGTCTIECNEVVDFDSALEYNEYAEAKEEEIRNNMKKSIRKKFV